MNYDIHRQTRILIGLIIVLMATGCGVKRKALGAENEIIILASRSDRPALRKILQSVFNDTIFTPQPEPAWILHFTDPEGLPDLKRRTLLVIGSLGDQTQNPGTKVLRSLLGSDRFQKTLEPGEHVIFTRDQFAKDQLLLILSARNKTDLFQEVMEKRDLIRSQVEKLYNQRQGKYLFSSHRQEKLEQQLAVNYGWKLNIPWGWDMIVDSSEAQFVWLGREMPYQWLSVHWVQGLVAADDSSARAITRDYPLNFYKNIRYTDFKWKTKPVDFLHWTAWKTTGVWESTDEPKGGPFVHYVFFDGVTGRTYEISFLVFDPGGEKAIRLRQMDLIAHTFTVIE
ncbi:MAG: DUF4837 family protein [FCB group bacterium]|nr:DUF4837 family protein [FCB group bacterium]